MQQGEGQRHLVDKRALDAHAQFLSGRPLAAAALAERLARFAFSKQPFQG